VEHNVGLRAGGGAELEPEVVLPSQYFGGAIVDASLQPEKRLMLAVLEDAIHCYQDNLFSQRGKNKRLFDETEEWITTRGRDWFFSFHNVCESLGFNPEYVRRGLLRWKEINRRKQPQSGAWDKKKLAS